MASSIDERLTAALALVIVVDWKGSSARAWVWRQRASVNACPPCAQNKSTIRAPTMHEMIERKREREREREREGGREREGENKIYYSGHEQNVVCILPRVAAIT